MISNHNSQKANAAHAELKRKGNMLACVAIIFYFFQIALVWLGSKTNAAIAWANITANKAATTYTATTRTVNTTN